MQKEQLKVEREKMGYNKKQMASRLGFGYWHYLRVESGRYDISDRLIRSLKIVKLKWKIAQFFKLWR